MIRRVFAFVLMTVLIVATVCTAVAQQKSSQQLQAEMRHREVKQKLEQSRRESEFRRRAEKARQDARTTSSGSPKNADFESRQRVAKPKAVVIGPSEPAPKYRLVDGDYAAYSFHMQTQSEDEKLHMAGVALFRFEQNDKSAFRVLSRDNINYSTNPEESFSLPVGSRKIDATFSLPQDGIEPIIENSMPHLLGRCGDWFFPPLPRSSEKPRMKGYSVERGSFFNSTPSWDKRNQGHYEWEVRIVEMSNTLMTLADRRSFRSLDRAQEVDGTGEIVFDRSNGKMTSRTFRGFYSLFGKATTIAIQIQQLSTEQLRQLVQ